MQQRHPLLRLIRLLLAVAVLALAEAPSAAAHGAHHAPEGARMLAQDGPPICVWHCPAPVPQPLRDDTCCGHCPAAYAGALLAILPGTFTLLSHPPRQSVTALPPQARMASGLRHSPHLARGPPGR